MQLPIVHKLFYTWTGWPTAGGAIPSDPGDDFFCGLTEMWKVDGIYFRSRTWRGDQIQVACEVEPEVSPIFFTGRIKGRLQYAMRQAGKPMEFSRKVGMRAIGENVTATVEGYLREQLNRSDLADPRYVKSLADAAIENPSVDLTQPAETGSGRYWYNLHVVLAADGRYRIGCEDVLPRIRSAAQAWVAGSGCVLKAFAVMPDHIHGALRGAVDTSPADIAQDLRMALNHAAGCILYSDRMYVGTFSEYTLNALR